MPVPFLATQVVTGHPAFLDNLSYQTVGLMVVLTSLGGLAIVLGIIGIFTGAPRRVPVARAPLDAAGAGDAGAIPAEVFAAISAAVYATMGPGHAVVAVRPVNPLVQAWSVEGRRQIFQSHSFR